MSAVVCAYTRLGLKKLGELSSTIIPLIHDRMRIIKREKRRKIPMDWQLLEDHCCFAFIQFQEQNETVADLCGWLWS